MGDPPTSHRLRLEILPQPDDTTCGPTCLHAVYRYHGDAIPLEQVIAETPRLPLGGTLAVMLACHALEHGYEARIDTFNLNMFDPTWFVADHSPPQRRVFLREKLLRQAEAKGADDLRLLHATESYLRFLDLGGQIRLEDLTSRRLSNYLRRGLPILTGLSSTYLYRAPREYGPNDDDDDIRGTPSGHFVVIHGVDPHSRLIQIADPLSDNPGFGSQCYQVPMARLVGAIMLGVLTYDANLLILSPHPARRRTAFSASTACSPAAAGQPSHGISCP